MVKIEVELDEKVYKKLSEYAEVIDMTTEQFLSRMLTEIVNAKELEEFNREMTDMVVSGKGFKRFVSEDKLKELLERYR